jgi:hypothetical protein
VTRLAAAALAACCLLAACSGGGVEAAPSASSAACSTALAAAPATVLGAPRTPLDVAGAVGYGTPQVVVRCGVPALGPVGDRCIDVDGVPWVLTSTEGEVPVVLVTFGRAPAVELTVPAADGEDALATGQRATAAAVDLAPVATALPKDGRDCVGP